MSKRQNGFGPALGESLQSFIFRVLYRIGYSDFSTILTRGGWGDKPCVPYQAKNEFKTFDPDKLFKLYEKNTPGSQSCFSSPFPSKHFFIDTFYPVKQKSYSGQHVQIRYCQKCIEKQLYELGYAYFKAEWLTFSNCPVHNKRLSVVEHRLSLNETSEAVKNILIGKGAVIGNLVSMRRAADDNPPLFRVDLYFLPCAKDAIFDYIFFNEELCPDDYIDLIFTGLLKKENSNHPTWGARRKSLIRNIEYYYECVIEKSYSRMMTYIFNSMTIVSIPAPFDFIKDSGNFALKVKEKSCSDCREIACQMSNANIW